MPSPLPPSYRRSRIEKRGCRWRGSFARGLRTDSRSRWPGIALWYGPRWQPLAIEGDRRVEPLPSAGRAGAFFFSCGLDSFYSLRQISQRLPRSHPAAPQVAIFVIGYDLRKPLATERALANARAAADALGLILVPVRSNIPSLDDDYKLWTLQFGGPAFIAIAHALGRKISRAFLAADCDIPNLVPWSNHPATAPELSSHDVEIRQDGIEATRAQKAAQSRIGTSPAVTFACARGTPNWRSTAGAARSACARGSSSSPSAVEMRCRHLEIGF